MAGAPLIFDRRLVRRRRAAQTDEFLGREATLRLLDRLDDIRRGFPTVLVLGEPEGELAATLAGRAGTAWVVTAGSGAGPHQVTADEELLPFAPDRFDAALSIQALHWVNDLPGTLAQLRSCLKPDGLLLASLLGGETLGELRTALTAAELELTGGAGQRVAPFVDARTGGALLQRTGFALPVVDHDRLTVHYADALALMRDLRRQGLGNALLDRRVLRRDVLVRAAEIYGERFATTDGRVRATFDLLHLTAWKPHPSQPQALRPGSAMFGLDRILNPRG